MSTLIEVKDLKMYFPVAANWKGHYKHVLKAVDGVSFSIEKGKTFGLVGESGCGKTTVGRCLVRLYKPTGGQILYEGTDITNLTEKELQPHRKKLQMIFQDPYSSLDPRMTVNSIIAEPLLKTDLPKQQIAARAAKVARLDFKLLERRILQAERHVLRKENSLRY